MPLDITWIDDLSDAFDSMTPAQQAFEQAVCEACPWCRLSLEHTREEHYLTKPEGVIKDATFH